VEKAKTYLKTPKYVKTFDHNIDSRYIAVHNPLDYKKAINDASALKHRLIKYLLPVLIASFVVEKQVATPFPEAY
jgi:hypothetical protein